MRAAFLLALLLGGCAHSAKERMQWITAQYDLCYSKCDEWMLSFSLRSDGTFDCVCKVRDQIPMKGVARARGD